MNDPELLVEWRPVVDYEGLYEVSNTGIVRSIRGRKGTNGKILKPAFTKKGYLTVALSKNSSSKTKLVHQLVAKAFVSNPMFLPHVNHINGIKTDNNSLNLEWITHQGNMAHAIATGLFNNKGSNHPMHKLNEGDAVHILSTYNDMVKNLSVELGISRQTVKDIINGKTWRHVSLKEAGVEL